MKMDNLIRSNLYPLCESTIVNEKLLIFLIEKGVITEDLKEEIENSLSTFKKASLLYAHFKRSRPQSDLDLILNGLKLSGNIKAVQILELGSSNDELATKTIGFNNTMPSLLSSKDSKTTQMNFDASGARNFKTIGYEKIEWPIHHNVTLPVHNFAGRNQELKKLESLFLNNKNLILICGFGGLGKTEFCRKFMQNISEPGTSRIWLHGDTYDSLKRSVLSLARQVGVENDSACPSQMFEYLTRMMLKHCSRMVVVIDNVDSKFEEASKVIKMFRLHESIFIIVISRNKMILDNAGHTILLDVFSKKDAKTVLRNCIENISDSEADSLSKLVQYYPLALQQAVAYIKKKREDFLSSNYSVVDYIKEFEEKKLEMLDQRLNNFEHDYVMTTLVTWDITFNELSAEAIDFLKVLAFLDPDEISVEFFQEVCVELGYNHKFSNVVNMLKMYSFIKVEKLVISVHRLVQDVMREKEKVESGFAKKLLNVIGIVYAKRRCSKLEDDGVTHMRRIVQLVYGIGSVSLMPRYTPYRSRNPNELLVYIKSEIVLKLRETYNLSDCLELCEQVLSSDSQYNETHEKAFRALFFISKNHSNATSQVVLLLENSLKLKKSALGDNHEITTNFRIVLASILGDRERQLELVSEIKNYLDSNKPMREFYTLLILTMINGENWLTRDIIYKCAGSCYYKYLDFELLERLLPLYKKMLGEDDQLTLKVKNGMAEKFYYNTEYIKSIELLEQVIRSNIQTEIESAWKTMNYIAQGFYENGNYNEAKPLLERVLKFYKDHENEKEASNTKTHLALTLIKLDYSFYEAIDLALEYEPIHSTKGRMHEKVNFMSKVAWSFYYDKEYTKALELIEQVISSNIQTEVESAWNTMYYIAQGFYGNGNYNEAKILLERVIEFSKIEKNLIKAKYKLANTLFKLGCDLEYARSLYHQVLSHYETGEGKDSFSAKERKEKIKSLLTMYK